MHLCISSRCKPTGENGQVVCLSVVGPECDNPRSDPGGVEPLQVAENCCIFLQYILLHGCLILDRL